MVDFCAEVASADPQGEKPPVDTYYEGVSAAAFEERTVLGSKIETLRSASKMLSPLPVLADSSSLAQLDRKYPHLHFQDGIEGLILQAEESLVAACAMVGPDRPRYPYAVYHLIRSSLEMASVVCWVLAPESVDEKAARHCSLEISEIEHAIGRAKSEGKLSAFDELGRLKATAERIRKELLGLRPAEKVPGPGKMCEDFDRNFQSRKATGTTMRFQWGNYSGLLHGSSLMRRLLSLHDAGDNSRMQDPLLSEGAVLFAAWSLRHAHAAYEEASGSAIQSRIPKITLWHSQEGTS